MDIEEVKDNVVNGYRMPHPQHCSQELYVYIFVLLYMIIWICITLREISIDFELDILMQIKIFSMIDWLIV